MWDERDLGSVEEEKQRFEAMQYRLKSLQVECHIKKLQEQVDYYRYHRTRWMRIVENLKHWAVVHKSKKISAKTKA